MRKITLFSLLSILLVVGTSSAKVYDTKGYYTTLQVSPDVTPSALKKEYYTCAKKWHPDKNPQNIDQATKKFADIANAYDVLSDPVQRKTYDALLPERPASSQQTASGTTAGTAHLKRSTVKPSRWFKMLRKGFKENDKLKITVGAVALSYVTLIAVLRSVQRSATDATTVSLGGFKLHIGTSGPATFEKNGFGSFKFSIPL